MMPGISFAGYVAGSEVLYRPDDAMRNDFGMLNTTSRRYTVLMRGQFRVPCFDAGVAFGEP